MLSININFLRKAAPNTEVGKKQKIGHFTWHKMYLQSCFLCHVGLSCTAQAHNLLLRLFPQLRLTIHRGWSANTCGVFLFLSRSLCSAEMLLFFSIIFWLFLISVVFVCGRLCFQAKKDPLAHLIWSLYVTYQSMWPGYPYDDPFFAWLLHTFWKSRLFCFKKWEVIEFTIPVNCLCQ